MSIDPLSRPGTVLIDGGAGGESLLFTSPAQLLVARTLDEVAGVLEAVDAALEEGRYVAGYLAYEAGYAFERIAELPPPTDPLVWLGIYDRPRTLTIQETAALFDLTSEAPEVEQVHFTPGEAEYHRRIGTVKTHIREGDVYQINFTGRLSFRFEGSPRTLYHRLRTAQPVPHGAFVETGEATILCSSPELFFRRDADAILTRPMKGTVRRGNSAEEDAALQVWLSSDEKSRAENLMIVDLLRNDLSVVCKPGSVRVPDLFTTEPYETLTQMTSSVEGTLRPGMGYSNIFRALFPCGSVTGAPKIRAMQIIHALEQGRRGVYCGTIGYAAPDGRAVFNVAIRTAVLRGSEGVMGAGSGIVWDSDAAAEYQECLLKVRFLVPQFSLIETMRWEGHVPLMHLHVERLRASARHFGFPLDEDDLRERIRVATAGLDPSRAIKLRVTLEAEGQIGITATAADDWPDRPVRLAIAPERLDPDDIFRYHKTTRRKLLDDAYRKAREAGYDEIIFLNERGEVAEGSRSSIFIREGETYVTPPPRSGLLPGVYRRHLLETLPDVAERVLYLHDLIEADGIYVCNAVRGIHEAVLANASVPADGPGQPN